MNRRLNLLVVSAVLVLAGCAGSEEAEGDPSEDGQPGDPIRVVTTLPLLAELAERIGGERVEVVTLIPLGVDEHSFQPSPAVARDVARADLALVNGYNLEEALLSIVVENVAPGAPVVSAALGLAAREGGHVHEFIEGELDRAAIDRAVGEIGELAEAGVSGDLAVTDAIDGIDAIIHDLPSRSRTEAVREIDGFVHDVPRGVTTPEEALDAIVGVTRSYEPAAGPDAALAQIVSLLGEGETDEDAPADVLDGLDRLLGRLPLDDRDQRIRLVDVAVQDWRDGATSAEEALDAVTEAVSGGASEQPADQGAAIDDTVFASADPHLWLDARNFAVYAENVRDALIRVDADGADLYRSNAAEFIAEVEALHEELLDAFVQIPAEQRQMVVFHDAFQYFAAAYGFEVVASVAPANPNQERSAAAIVAIIETVQETGVGTIYREPQYSSESLNLISLETGTEIAILHSIPSEDAPTYVEMMRSNARSLVEGLSGTP